MKKDLVLNERELKEIQHALYYMSNLAHGTVGHNILMLLGKFAESVGFEMDPTGVMLFNGSDIEKELVIE